MTKTIELPFSPEDVIKRASEPPPIHPLDAAQLLRTLLLHNRHVEGGMLLIRQELERRAHHHDDSKLTAEEFAGFSRINAAAREFPYGSPEYRAGLDAERSVVDLHYRRNSHHPEHGKALGDQAEAERGSPDDATYWAAWRPMTFLDIIEMVCDWRGAWLAYGSQGTWTENLDRQRERYGKTLRPEQWWLVDQVAAFIVPEPRS